MSKLRISLTPTIRIVNDENEKIEIMKKLHDDPIQGGHSGQKRLYAKIKSKYYWKGMSKQISNFVKDCQKCLLNKVKSSTKEPMILTPTPQKAFDVIIVDVIGPLPMSNNGNKYAVTILCDLSKYLIMVAIRDKTAQSVAKCIFENATLIFGPAREMRTDLGTEFKNELMKKVCELSATVQEFSTAYHHQTVGTAERNHRVFNEYVRSYVTNMNEWDEYIKFFAFCYNTTHHSSFNHKLTPFELVFGRQLNSFEHLFIGGVEPVYNIDDYSKELKFKLQIANQQAKVFLDKSKLLNKKYYDKTQNKIELKIGDKVLIKKEPRDKYQSIYSGPFEVIEIIDSNIKILDNNKKIQKIHKNRVKLY